MSRLTRKQRLRRRHVHIRKRVYGSAERPRLLVRRSLRHIEASLINDVEGKTIATATTRSGSLTTNGMNKTDQAGRLGEMIAAIARDKGIGEVVFDRGGHPYHGRVKALAEKAREAGLRF